MQEVEAYCPSPGFLHKVLVEDVGFACKVGRPHGRYVVDVVQVGGGYGGLVVVVDGTAGSEVSNGQSVDEAGRECLKVSKETSLCYTPSPSSRQPSSSCTHKKTTVTTAPTSTCGLSNAFSRKPAGLFLVAVALSRRGRRAAMPAACVSAVDEDRRRCRMLKVGCRSVGAMATE